MASLHPSLGIHGELPNHLEQSVRFRFRHATGEVVLAVVPLDPTSVEIGGCCRELAVRGFQGKESVVVPADGLGSIPSDRTTISDSVLAAS